MGRKDVIGEDGWLEDLLKGKIGSKGTVGVSNYSISLQGNERGVFPLFPVPSRCGRLTRLCWLGGRRVGWGFESLAGGFLGFAEGNGGVWALFGWYGGNIWL
jgi:hypothetical protein